MDEAIAWAKKWPAMDAMGEFELEVRPLFEEDDFGEDFTPELRQQGRHMRQGGRETAVVRLTYHGEDGMTVLTLSFDNVVEVVSVMADAFEEYPVMQYIWAAGAGCAAVSCSPAPARAVVRQ